jgi:hypothetical protein
VRHLVESASRMHGSVGISPSSNPLISGFVRLRMDVRGGKRKRKNSPWVIRGSLCLKLRMLRLMRWSLRGSEGSFGLFIELFGSGIVWIYEGE